MKVLLALASPMLETPNPLKDNDYAKLNNPKENRTQAAGLLAGWYTKLDVLGHSSIRLKSQHGTTLAVIKNGYVQFLSVFGILQVGTYACVRQRVVFSYTKSPVEKGFALRFLLDFLLNETGRICTDDNQYEPGKKLWERAVGEAYTRGYFVYHTDTSEKLIRLATPKDFKAAEHSIWGTEELYEKHRVVISKTELED